MRFDPLQEEAAGEGGRMNRADAFIKSIFVGILALAAGMFLYAMMIADGRNEAHIGKFNAEELTDGWTLQKADGTTVKNVSLPLSVKTTIGETVYLRNMLPKSIRGGMHLCLRAQRQNVTIYINGEERGHYRAEDYGSQKAAPSAFLLIDLRDSDANAKIEVEIVSRDSGNSRYHMVTYAYGSNVWFPVIAQSIVQVTTSSVLALLGMLTIVAYFFARKKLPASKTVLYLGEAILTAGLWSLSESAIRQLIFRAPSQSNIFAFLLIEILAAFVLMYFNEVQKHRYDKFYVLAEGVILLQMLVNSALNAAGVADYYDTLGFSHLWSGLGILLAITTIILDIRSGRIKDYSITSLGMLCLLASSVFELMDFYFSSTPQFGLFLGVGLVLLLGATALQSVSDALRDKEQKNEADEANRAKSSFLANMSHEIRTPINAILGMDEMILRESSERDVISYAEDIESAGKTLLSLINDILDFSKVEEGKMEILPAQYDLSSLINDLVNMIRGRADNKGLLLEVNVDETMPHLLFGDEIRIRQCVLNLLTNAVKYTERGSVTLEVGYEKLNESRISLRFSVIDTGIGLKREDMDKLFSPFSRIEESRNRSIEGTGLGISITKSLLGLMNSKLEVESVYGEGSTFSFALEQPVVRWSPIGKFTGRFVTENSARTAYRESFRAPDAHVLVVDDMPVNLTVIRGLLKKTQISVDTATSGAEAIARAARRQYDVAFIDHMMPGMDGIETLHEMKKLPRSEKTVFIALTANAISGSREQYLEAGFTDYLPKPVDSKKLEEMLMAHLPAEKLSRNDGAGGVDSAPDVSIVLAATGDERLCHLVEEALGDAFHVESCRSGADVTALAERIDPALILLDVHIGETSGFEALRALKRSSRTHDIPVVLMTDEENTETEELGFRNGATDFIRKAYLKDALLRRTKRIIQLDRLQTDLQREVKQQVRRTEQLGREMMITLSRAVDAKDRFTSDHSGRVAAYAAEIARRMGRSGREQEMLYEMGLLHDIGKIGVSEEVLNESELTDEDFSQIKRHTLIGSDILRSITEMPELAQGARSHHERYDGTGYPDGLKGRDIPEAARILCVADSYDAMTSTRVYSLPRPQAVVRAEIERCSGTQFDPEIARIMLQMIDEDTDYAMTERTADINVWKGRDQLWSFDGTNGGLDGSDRMSAAAPSSLLPDWLYHTEGIDVSRGLRFCGSEETYLDTLKIYAKTCAEFADEIGASFAAGDIATTAVKTHALKSTSRAVGAEELGALAEKMEMAGKAGDTQTLDAELDGLLVQYRALGRKLMPLLGEDGPDASELPPISDEQLHKTYDMIRRLLDDFEYDRAAEMIGSLSGYRLPEGEDIRCGELTRAAENFEWDRIAEILA